MQTGHVHRSGHNTARTSLHAFACSKSMPLRKTAPSLAPIPERPRRHPYPLWPVRHPVPRRRVAVNPTVEAGSTARFARVQALSAPFRPRRPLPRRQGRVRVPPADPPQMGTPGGPFKGEAALAPPGPPSQRAVIWEEPMEGSRAAPPAFRTCHTRPGLPAGFGSSPQRPGRNLKPPHSAATRSPSGRPMAAIWATTPASVRRTSSKFGRGSTRRSFM